jgi:iron(II)-dependent oxidoreductase
MGRRLLTESEWEAAARQGRGRGELRFWPWGDTWSVNDIRCNCDLAYEMPGRQVKHSGIPPMMPFGSFPHGASFAGVNDLSGNAFEITSSAYLAYPGFKPINQHGIRVSSSDFQEDKIAIRGGDAN